MSLYKKKCRALIGLFNVYGDAWKTWTWCVCVQTWSVTLHVTFGFGGAFHLSGSKCFLSSHPAARKLLHWSHLVLVSVPRLPQANVLAHPQGTWSMVQQLGSPTVFAAIPLDHNWRFQEISHVCSSLSVLGYCERCTKPQMKTRALRSIFVHTDSVPMKTSPRST